MRILIVEDQQKLADSIKKGLEHKGYAVDAIYDGGQAMRRLEHDHHLYDLILLDRMLPNLDGMIICQALRKMGITVPILMLTAKDAVEDRVQGLDAGADDYLVKPFAFEELLARVHALLRRPVDSVVTELKAGDLTLDTTKHQVLKGTKEVSLTSKEFAILEYCMRNPNQVLTREQIVQHVWDFASDSASNVVDAHIKNLRKKIQKKNETILETVHGMGYRIKA
ncbi:MAG TPA: two-component system response regulator RppA [Candidatus Paceibacterota bacterium]